MIPDVSRRAVLGGAFAVVITLSGCADKKSSGAGGSARWTFVDDRGNRIELASRPKTIVAFSTTTAALAEMGIMPQGIFAWFLLKDDVQLKDVDLTDVVTIGETSGELDIERLAELAPDVVITAYDPTDKSLYGITDEQRAKVEGVAPIIGIDNTAALTTQLTRFQELGRSLGADLSDSDFLEARQRFNEGSQQVEKAAGAKPGLRVMVVSSSDRGMNVAQPKPNADLSYYADLGVSFVVPDGEGIFWWEEVSAENLDKYDADVILVDSRSGDAARKALETHPVWGTLPAVEAGQVFPWHAYDPPTYNFYVDALKDLSSAIESSQVLS